MVMSKPNTLKTESDQQFFALGGLVIVMSSSWMSWLALTV